jgi:glutamine synthetase
LQAAVLAAGLDGITRNLDPGEGHANDNYANPLPPGSCGRLPSSLGEALAALEADSVLQEALGESFCQSYLKLRDQQWQHFQSLGHSGAAISDWEWDTGLDG